ncbi:uncharacterized protein [Centroberyx affinis]|uniref:uncharacterized protein n=1 Tax=Centroberyx affinis TaxID=166261 RepID=UPI003A5BD550
MDTLKSMQDKLCMWLSSDPEYILDQCGDILSRNQFRKVEQQSSAVEKMRMLLKIIIEMGEDTCQRFYDILKQHQAHYQQLQQFFADNAQGSCRPKVFADNNSVVTTREIKDVKAKSFSMRIDTGSRSTESCQSGEIAAGQAPQADYVARSGGVICADKISGVTIDGAMDFSVQTSYASAAKPKAVERMPSSQGPSAKTIQKHKVELTECLRAEPSLILQHVHAESIVRDDQYQRVMNIPQPEDKVIYLIDRLIDNGEESCSPFLKLLENAEILNTYPKLKKIDLSIQNGRE